MSLFFYTAYLFWISLYSKPISKAMEGREINWPYYPFGWLKWIRFLLYFMPKNHLFHEPNLWRVGNRTHHELDLCEHAYPVLDFFLYLSLGIQCPFLSSKLFESSGISIIFHFLGRSFSAFNSDWSVSIFDPDWSVSTFSLGWFIPTFILDWHVATFGLDRTV